MVPTSPGAWGSSWVVQAKYWARACPEPLVNKQQLCLLLLLEHLLCGLHVPPVNTFIWPGTLQCTKHLHVSQLI